MQAHPRLGRFILAVTDEPQTTRSWATGAEGEQKLGAMIEEVASPTIRALHDRRIPSSRANIDHLVVTPSGVFVIDAKKYKGVVRCRDVGGWFRLDRRLYVGSRDCSKLLVGMERQVAAVRSALADSLHVVPVTPVICFVEAEWKLLAQPFQIGDVRVTWPRGLIKFLQAGGSLGQDKVVSIQRLLATRLRSAT